MFAEKLLKNDIKRAEEKMKKLKTKSKETGNDKAYQYMKKNYDEIVKI